MVRDTLCVPKGRALVVPCTRRPGLLPTKAGKDESPFGFLNRGPWNCLGGT